MVGRAEVKKTYLARECLSLKLSDGKDSALCRAGGKGKREKGLRQRKQ